jgi:hypothetical protein
MPWILLVLVVLGFGTREFLAYLKARSWIARQMAAARAISPAFADSIHGMRYLGTSGPFSVTVSTFDYPYDDTPPKEVALLCCGETVVQVVGYADNGNFRPESLVLGRGRNIFIEVDAGDDQAFPGSLVMYPTPSAGEGVVQLCDTNWDGKFDVKIVTNGKGRSRCFRWREGIGWVEDQEEKEVGEPGKGDSPVVE